ncbi:hypothetical protein F4779DRAFT_620429 [Xylariaceae sp. FL0662B]|nr:hypothetical protein F4779DRAFT_620429 [Xylariaceae sp. FL0662B]
MPPGRPPKRPGEAGIESLDSPGGCKLQKLDRDRPAPNDFSSVVKSKLQSYTRTGQACDRCKVRKIRCDALPEGCSHCINQNLECYVTDRVTGRTERRGYMQELEREKMDMLNHIRHLEKLLQSKGVEMKPWHSTSFPAKEGPNVAFDEGINHGMMHESATKEQWSQIGSSIWVKDPPSKIPVADISHALVEPRPADTQLGVGTDHAPLTSIQGTTLSILGSTIDMGSIDAPDMDEPTFMTEARPPLYNKSLQALLQSCTQVNPPLRVDLPPRGDAFTYAEWYFLMIYPFHPILHKPTFMTLLTRFYDDPNFQPTVAETVIVHMVFASIYLQYGLRNQDLPKQKAHLNDLSNKHYHFAASKFFDLASSHTLSDVQALTMICAHTMRFPKPGPSILMTNYTLSMALDLGLHRAWRKPGEGTNLENELRKRIWWTLLGTSVALNGRMGRPMPLRLEEIDVEFPEMIPDELLTEEGVDTTKAGKCTYEIGVMAFKITMLFLEMYANIYCARRDPDRYLAVVEALEAQLKAWRDNLPNGLRLSGAENDNPMFPLYAEYMALEFRLSLRHPGTNATNDPKMIATNTKICGEVASDMLRIVHKLYRLKSLDTTWHCISIYIVAIFSTLVEHWQRRHDITAAELQVLREDMGHWLDIIAETQSLIGSGAGIHDAVGAITDRTIAWIEHDRFRNSTVEPVPPPPTQLPQDMLKHSPHTPPYTTGMATTPTPNAGAMVNGSMNHIMPTPRNSYYPEPTADSGAYPLPYTDAPATNGITYEADNSFLYPHAAGQVVAAQAHAHAQAHVQAQTQAQAQVPIQANEHHPLTTFAAQASQMTPPADIMWRQQPPPPPPPSSSGAGNTWHHWTGAIVDSQDRYSANALMSLGGSGPTRATTPNMASSTAPNDMGLGVDMPPVATTTAAMQWPLLLFSEGMGGA